MAEVQPGVNADEKQLKTMLKIGINNNKSQFVTSSVNECSDLAINEGGYQLRRRRIKTAHVEHVGVFGIGD